MPLMMDGGGTPSLLAAKRNSRAAGLTRSDGTPAEFINVALINNMPDAALEDTETQFLELLETASGDIPVHVKLYSLPGIPRGERGQQHLRNHYLDLDDLWNREFDGVIMTGTEPRHADLRKEPYWNALTSVLDWAEHNTVSTVLSCLAAHAGVLYSDGIPRYAHDDKQFGVFESKKICDHAITRSIPDFMCTPHSRWNEVRENDLLSSGYVVLAKSAEAGVDLFVKKRSKSLFVHFQGHPEYGARTLLKEYRRDIKRFLRGERKNYPSMPQGYFDASATKLLNAFREMALTQPREELLTAFPEDDVAGTLIRAWHSSATSVYRNWLHYLAPRAWLRSNVRNLRPSGTEGCSEERFV